MIKAVLFDLDGTLLDTDKLIFMSYQHLFDTFRPDYPLTFKEVQGFLGPSINEIGPRYFKEDCATLLAEYRKYNLQNHHFVQPIHHAEYVLKELKQRGYKIGIVTTKKKDATLKGLQMFDMDIYIDFIVDCDMVTKLKPDPQGINMSLSHFGILPSEAMMVGDSITDLLAARAAGCKCVAVGYSIKGKFYNDENVDYVINDLRDIFKYLD